MSRLLLGVVGHVDHGKTALVRALTGIETDRLAEEKRRGISIALGFAHLGLPGGGVADLIDMPGHERFVRTMISGATGIGAVLLVVSAGEGIKPQTAEHVDIAGLLGVRTAIVAVSKADLATRARCDEIARDAAGLAERAGMRVAGSVLTSAATGAGIDALRQAIAGLAGQGEPAVADDGFPFLPIDRAFTVAGHGTVVTGTLRRGALQAGGELAVLPSGVAVRVRGLQVHGAPVARAEPGQRVAANLRGIEIASLPRGAALTAGGMLSPAGWLSVQLRAVPGTPPLPNAARLRLLFGTAEADARLRLLDRDALEPGQTAFAQLHCTPPVALPAREPFVLRTPSPAATVAGGRVLHPDTVRQRRHAPGALAQLAGLAGSAPAEIVRAELDRAGEAGSSLAQLARLAGVSPSRAAGFLDGSGAVTLRSGGVVSAPALNGVAARLPGLLRPHGDGLSREVLGRLQPGVAAAVLDAAATLLARSGALRQDRGLIRVHETAQERAAAEGDAAIAAALLRTLQAAGLTPPDADTLAPDPQTRRLLNRLVKEGTVVRTVDRVQKRDLFFHPDAVAAARQRLAPLLREPGLLMREAAEALGISRKFSVPLMEHLDAVRFTVRVADRRMLAQMG